jgi:hypothetical protein
VANQFRLFGFGRWRVRYGMKDEQHRFLSLAGQLPARLTSEQAGWVLNCQSHDIPALISSRLLKPLGNPAQNGGKFFCTADVLELTKDRSWLVKVTNTINQHWQRQNFRKKCPSLNGVANSRHELHELPAA